MRRYIDLLTTALLALAAIMPAVGLSACSDSSDPSDPSGPSDPAMAYLTINVSAGIPQESRANDIPTDGSYTNTFEDGIAPYEQMYTLRAIIVRPGGIIEHNELLHTAPSGQGFNQYTYASLKVVAGETKTIYLFANEDYTRIYDSTGATTLLKEKLTTLHIGDTFPADEYNGMIISNSSASQAPLIDNRGDDESKKSYLPMSEVFDVKIESVNKDGTNLYQSADLFITRAAVKFGFYVQLSKDKGKPNTSFTINSFTVSSLADREYLLPNNVTYSPEKYPLTTPGVTQNFITDFTAPAQAQFGSYTFSNVGMTFNPFDDNLFEIHTFEPQIYFPETKLYDSSYNTGDKKYSVGMSLTVDGASEPYVASATLPNLPYQLPRNTFVKVYVTIAYPHVNFEVDVVPYAEVKLNPSFGFDDTNEKVPSGDNPWATITPEG